LSLADLTDQPPWLTAAAHVIRALPAGRYRAMNWIARGGTDPFWGLMSSDLGRLRFRCDLRDPLMREVCITGRYEPQETMLLQRLLRPGMTFVDVGANWGYFTLAAAHLIGPSGRIVCVEADPRACETIRANIARNSLSNVTLAAVAADDTPGVIGLQAYGEETGGSGNFGLAATTTTIAGSARFEVPARRLDDVLDEADVEDVDLMKMDIEGAEARALSGLQRRLASGRVKRLILELHPAHLRDQGCSAAEVVAHLQEYGYLAWRIDHSPATHRLAARGAAPVESLLTPLARGSELGDWPHLLWARDEEPWT
jgi:FkbM family methyltransferase